MRGASARGMGGGGILRLLPGVYRLFGFKGLAIAAVAVGAYLQFSGNLGVLTGTGGLLDQGGSSESRPGAQSAEEQELVEFVSVVLADTEAA